MKDDVRLTYRRHGDESKTFGVVLGVLSDRHIGHIPQVTEVFFNIFLCGWPVQTAQEQLPEVLILQLLLLFKFL